MARDKHSLTPLQKIILQEFSKSTLKNSFYWTGGTALARLYLYHRLSYDIDFFSDKKVNYEQVLKFVQRLSKKIGLKKIEHKRIFDRWEFILRNKTTTRLEFVHYDFKNLKPRKKWRAITVDSLEDMSANKIMSVVDRNEPKDILDVYFLLQRRGVTLKKLLGLVKKKFGVEISPATFWAEALLKSKNLLKITPLLRGGLKEKILKDALEFIEQESARETKKLIG